jgi:hypothetical protein
MDNVRGLTPHACSTCAISTEFTKELERNIERKTPPISKDEFDLYYKGSIKDAAKLDILPAILWPAENENGSEALNLFLRPTKLGDSYAVVFN